MVARPRSRFLNAQSALTRPRTIIRKKSKGSTRLNPQGWVVPYAGRTHVTPRTVPATVVRVIGPRIEQLLRQRANLNRRILLATPRSRSAVGPNYSNLHTQRNKINRNIQRYRGMIASSAYISGPLFASMIRNMNAQT
jgi:hypothetical protein